MLVPAAAEDVALVTAVGDVVRRAGAAVLLGPRVVESPVDIVPGSVPGAAGGGAGVVGRRTTAAVVVARHSLVQQRPHNPHAAAFSGSSSGDPAASAAGQPMHPLAPALDVRPAPHAAHAVAPSAAA